MHRRAKRGEARELINNGLFEKPWECWTWPFARDTNGYGQLCVNRTTTKAHRLSFETHVRPLNDLEHVDHRCRNRLCFNPHHLRAVTQQRNSEYRPHNKANSTGYRGVHRLKATGKYQARVRHHGKLIYLGSYRCPTHAGLVSLTKRKELGFLDEN